MRFHNRVSIAGNLTHYDHLKRTFVPSAASCTMGSNRTFVAQSRKVWSDGLQCGMADDARTASVAGLVQLII